MDFVWNLYLIKILDYLLITETTNLIMAKLNINMLLILTMLKLIIILIIIITILFNIIKKISTQTI